MTRNDSRQTAILDALNKLGEVTPNALHAWLGRPYCFDSNLQELASDGRIVVYFEHGNVGIITLLALPKKPETSCPVPPHSMQ